MTGRNIMIVNQATMIEAVQGYLDGQFATGKAPTVTKVKHQGGNTAEVGHFEIELLDETKEVPG